MMKYSYDVEETDFDELVVARSHEVPVLLDIRSLTDRRPATA
jgi:putative thioredoxin